MEMEIMARRALRITRGEDTPGDHEAAAEHGKAAAIRPNTGGAHPPWGS